jgi:hypothetical protein
MQVRRRVHAHELFGEAGVASSAKLGKALFLRRVDADAFSVRHVEPDRAAAAAAATLEFDLDILHRWQLAASGSLSRDWLPRASETLTQSEEVIRSGLAESGAECLLVDIPLGAGPRESRSMWLRCWPDSPGSDHWSNRTNASANSATRLPGY